MGFYLITCAPSTRQPSCSIVSPLPFSCLPTHQIHPLRISHIFTPWVKST